MEWRQVLGPRQSGEGERVVNRAVSPASVSRILLAGVLRVVEEEVDVLRQVEAGGPFGVEGKAARPEGRLVVGKIGERGRFRLDPVADRRTRVADALGADAEWADRETAAACVMQLETARHVAQQHREQGRGEIPA